MNKILNANTIDLPQELNKNIDKVLLQIAKAKKELEKTREIIRKVCFNQNAYTHAYMNRNNHVLYLQVNKLSVALPDLILPQKKSRISKKKCLYYTILVAICITVSFKLKNL